MGLRVHANVVARSVSSLLAVHNRSVERNIGQLSSGHRILRSRDDAAGQAIAARFRGQVSGLAQATGNAQDGMHLIQTAEGAMDEVHAVLGRMRDLVVQGATDTLTLSDRSHLTDELAALGAEIDRIGTATAFNTKKLLDGSLAGAGLTFQVGANAGEILNVRLDTVSSAALGVLSTQISIDNAANASATIARLDQAIESVSRFRGAAGALVNRLEHTLSDLGVMHHEMAGSESRLRDADLARTSTRLATGQVLAQSTAAMLAQANAQPQSVLALLR